MGVGSAFNSWGMMWEREEERTGRAGPWRRGDLLVCFQGEITRSILKC